MTLIIFIVSGAFFITFAKVTEADRGVVAVLYISGSDRQSELETRVKQKKQGALASQFSKCE